MSALPFPFRFPLNLPVCSLEGLPFPNEEFDFV